MTWGLTRPDRLATGAVDLIAFQPAVPAAELGFVVLGALLVRRQPTNRVGWLFLVLGLAGLTGDFAYEYGTYALLREPGSLPAGDWAGWYFNTVQSPLLGVSVTQLLLRFPSGSLMSDRWRWLIRFALAAAALLVVAGAIIGPSPGVEHLEEYPDAEGVGWTLLSAAFFCLLGSMAVGAVALVLRLVRSRGDERQQLKWLAFAGAGIAAAAALGDLPERLGGEAIVPYWDVVLGLAFLGMPVAAGIAIFKYRLYDIDVVIRRTIVYGTIVVLIGAAYVGAATALGVAAGRRLPLGIAVLVTVAATVGFQPARRWLERVASRRLLGERVSGEELLRRVGGTLEHSFDTSELAARVADTVRQGLAVEWVRMSVGGISEGVPQAVGVAGAVVGGSAHRVAAHAWGRRAGRARVWAPPIGLTLPRGRRSADDAGGPGRTRPSQRPARL